MKTIGFVISHKNEEERRAILPTHLDQVKHVDHLLFETGYGDAVGFTDADYIAKGAKIGTREEVLACDVVLDVKLGDADYLDQLAPGKLLVGWAHAVQKTDFTDDMLAKGHTVLAWEEIYEGGRYIFYRNREVAGEAGVLQGFRYCGKMPYDATVAIIGNGQTAKGAMRILHGLGATVDVYPRKFEKLFREKMYDYDVLVNCVMWDTSRTDRLIYKEELKNFKPGTLIIDISCDPGLEIETTRGTSIDDPVYTVDGVVHYAVDNTPAMFPKTVSKVLSKEFAGYLDCIVEEQLCKSLEDAIVIKDGCIVDERIREFREARGLFCK